MLEPATMRHCNNASLADFPIHHLAAALGATRRRRSLRRRLRSLTEDHDPVRSPDAEPAANPSAGPLRKEGEGYILRTDVEEVVLNATVLEGSRLCRT